MSQIVSPHPPIRITISIDRQTGVASMVLSEPMTTEMMTQTLVALSLDAVTDRIRQLENLGALQALKYSDPSIPTEIPLKALLTLCLTMIQDRMKQQAENPVANVPSNPFADPGGNFHGA